MSGSRLLAIGCRLATLVSLAGSAGAQQQGAASHANHGVLPAAKLSHDEIVSLARVHVAVIATRDSINAHLAKAGNKTNSGQRAYQDTLRAKIAAIYRNGGVSESEYGRRSFIVSTDTISRHVFDSVVVALTGAPLPGYQARAALVAVPPGPAGVHIGHVMNGFNESPNLAGLLPLAIAETRIAIGHATLAGRQPTNLDYMKLHVSHVVHALDPTMVKLTAPGLGYGVKKAAEGVATHIELAAAAEGASPAIVTHSKHIAAAARSTAARVDEILALTKKVETSTSAEEVVGLISQILAKAEQLSAGTDANADGRITFEMGEGGLQQADQHVRLMLGIGGSR
jgi:hypothetical protein